MLKLISRQGDDLIEVSSKKVIGKFYPFTGEPTVSSKARLNIASQNQTEFYVRYDDKTETPQLKEKFLSVTLHKFSYSPSHLIELLERVRKMDNIEFIEYLNDHIYTVKFKS